MRSRRIVYAGHRGPAFNRSRNRDRGPAARTAGGEWTRCGGVSCRRSGDYVEGEATKQSAHRGPGLTGHPMTAGQVPPGKARGGLDQAGGDSESPGGGGGSGHGPASQHHRCAPDSGHLVSQRGGGVGTEGRPRAALGGIAAAPAGLLDRLVPWVTAVCLVVGVLLYVIDR